MDNIQEVKKEIEQILKTAGLTSEYNPNTDELLNYEKKRFIKRKVRKYNEHNIKTGLNDERNREFKELMRKDSLNEIEQEIKEKFKDRSQEERRKQLCEKVILKTNTKRYEELNEQEKQAVSNKQYWYNIVKFKPNKLKVRVFTESRNFKFLDRQNINRIQELINKVIGKKLNIKKVVEELKGSYDKETITEKQEYENFKIRVYKNGYAEIEAKGLNSVQEKFKKYKSDRYLFI